MLKKKFRIALASAGLNQAAWARLHKVSEPALTQLLHGRIKSKRLSTALNSFIEREFSKLKLDTGKNRDLKAA